MLTWDRLIPLPLWWTFPHFFSFFDGLTYQCHVLDPLDNGHGLVSDGPLPSDGGQGHVGGEEEEEPDEGEDGDDEGGEVEAGGGGGAVRRGIVRLGRGAVGLLRGVIGLLRGAVGGRRVGLRGAVL